MATTIDIIIKGIAICYKKMVNGRTVWKVLFPFDNCHNVLFSWKISDGSQLPDPKISFARAGGRINFTVTGGTAVPPSESETQNFRNHVLNLTNTTDLTKSTHTIVKKKPNWSDGTVLMEINDAKFSVYDYVGELTTERPIRLVEENERNLGTAVSVKQLGTLAHSVKATIQLNEGATLRVNGVDQDFRGGETLIFDNDCKDEREGNDMDMFYEKIIFEPDTDPTKNKRRFIVGGRKVSTRSIPVDLDEGKPCLVVEVSDPSDLPD